MVKLILRLNKNIYKISCLIILFAFVGKVMNIFHNRGVCYGILGCFNITEDFHHYLYRPINYLPTDPQYYNTTIFLYRRSWLRKKSVLIVPKKWHTINVRNDKITNFNANKETKFIITVYRDTPYFSNWMHEVTDELLHRGDFNVFIVDWSNATHISYLQAASNSRVAAAQVALFIKNLHVNHGMNYDKVHLIGGSLAAHFIGYVGKELAKDSIKIGRLTGLDPSKPLFQYMPSTVRLDRSDADFVDVIHTDTNYFNILKYTGLGSIQPIGHIDFYPNGGVVQPGCRPDNYKLAKKEPNLIKKIELVLCHHFRAVQLFNRTINGKDCPMTAYECESWEQFQSNDPKCMTCGPNGERCAQMGYNAIDWKRFKSNNESKLFFLKTTSEPPFCIK